MWLYYFFLFGLGAIIGSFLNVVVMRSIEGRDWVKGRSECDSCHHILSWYDNIPLLSYVWLKGRCRYCGAKIPLQHPIMELLVGLLFVWWGLIGREFFKLVEVPGFNLIQPLFWLVIGLILLVVVFTDLFYGVIPDCCVWLGGILTVFYRILLWKRGIMATHDVILSGLAGLGAWLFFYGLYRLTKKKGLGLGDVYLAPLLGLLLGWPRILIGLMLAFILGAIVGLSLMVKAKKTLKSSLPFGPFMVGGSFLALVWGMKIWLWLVS